MEFLVTKGAALWNKNTIGDASRSPKDFDLYSLNPGSETVIFSEHERFTMKVLMVAIRQSQLETAKKVLELDSKYKPASNLPTLENL